MTALLTDATRDLTTRLGEELKRPHSETLTRQPLRTLGRSADALAGITLSTWQWVCETLQEEGFEARELAGHCRVVLDGIDGGLAAYERLLAQAKASDLSQEDAGLRALEAKLPALREARPKVAAALDLSARPPQPIDEEKLAESRAAFERGEFVAIDDAYLARLRAGEDF